MTADEFRARELDVTTPTAARMYDYYLGGTAHYTIDKVFGERMLKVCPYLDVMAHHNRAFLQRASLYMAVEGGIEQFLDIGSGIPTAGNTHHVVRGYLPDARVVYVDNDLEAVNQSFDLLASEGTSDVVIIEADVRHPESILEHPETLRLLDFDRPLGLLLVGVLPFVSDDDRPYELMARYLDQLASGSYVALSHGSADELTGDIKETFLDVIQSHGDETRDGATLRNREQFTAFFDGLTILEPGVVYAPDWRPTEPVDTDDPTRPSDFAAVARKP